MVLSINYAFAFKVTAFFTIFGSNYIRIHTRIKILLTNSLIVSNFDIFFAFFEIQAAAVALAQNTTFPDPTGHSFFISCPVIFLITFRRFVRTTPLLIACVVFVLNSSSYFNKIYYRKL